ncbi:MAG TPA: sigma-54-dependent Fis family transcriptional regulator [Dyella sp.]|nr:sigma-54-dependent Fis family transcriptional regulator [Dyella sp.]
MRHTAFPESIDTARRRFFDGGSAPRGLISETILASWRRCLEQGLVATGKPSVAPVERHTLGELQERHESLRRLCRPELEALYASANQAGSIVILTAPDGFILDALGDADFLDKAARVSLRPGVPWSEQATGTNAIGTALVERRSVEVRGAEHYHAPHRVLSCSASPIFDPQGRVVGVLDLSGHASVHHLHALGMVQLAVEQIEHRLFETAFDGADIVRIQPDPALIGTAREGMLVFEGHRLAAANRHALRLLGLDWSELGKRRYDELFASALPVPGSVGSMRCQTGDMVHARRDAQRSRIHVPSTVRAPREPAPAKQAIRPLRAPTAVFDPVLDAAIDRQVRLLDADITVLLQGETGTGKEVVARELHRRSARAQAPFVAVNCASLPEALIESELFGHQPGAFTGARREGSPGLLREAHGGVLFLDELGDMPLALQSRLLRVLQEREVTPLGGGRAHAIDVRVIAATHRQLQQAVERGEFRADLYFRVAQSVLHLPPLRAHPDVADTVRRLWAALGAEQVPMWLAPGLVQHLAACRWPGNVRELVGVLRSLMALGTVGATLTEHDLPDGWRGAVAASTGATSAAAEAVAGNLHDLEAQAIDQALAACRGNMAAAARKLGISRSTLYRRLEARQPPAR